MLKELEKANNYIYEIRNKKDKHLQELEIYAKEHNVPIVTPEVADFLNMICEIHKPKTIIEVGTAIGYSGTILAKNAMNQNGKLFTIEIDKESIEIARENFEKENIRNVEMIHGDAVEEIKKIDEKFDMAFIDAAKGKYEKFFNDIYEKMNDNGILIIDNILFRGYVYHEEYPKRYKTIVKKLRAFLQKLYAEYNFSLLPFGDGIGLVRKGENEIR